MVIAPEIQALVMLAITAFISYAVPRAAALLFAYAEVKLEQYKATLTTEQQLTLKLIVTEGIRMAEQSGTKGLIENTFTAKKTAAIDYTQRVLDEHGLKGISVQTISDQIEAALQQGLHKEVWTTPG